jgi:hypothetical protein
VRERQVVGGAMIVGILCDERLQVLDCPLGRALAQRVETEVVRGARLVRRKAQRPFQVLSRGAASFRASGSIRLEE